MTSSHSIVVPCLWFLRLASALDRRSAPRFVLLLLGAVLARGRRAVTSWIRAAKLGDQFRPCCTTVAAVADVLTTVADRFSLETTFRDVKEVVGAGRQQVRFVWANVGAFHLCLWTFTMTEA